VAAVRAGRSASQAVSATCSFFASLRLPLRRASACTLFAPLRETAQHAVVIRECLRRLTQLQRLRCCVVALSFEAERRAL